MMYYLMIISTPFFRSSDINSVIKNPSPFCPSQPLTNVVLQTNLVTFTNHRSPSPRLSYFQRKMHSLIDASHSTTDASLDFTDATLPFRHTFLSPTDASTGVLNVDVRSAFQIPLESALTVSRDHFQLPVTNRSISPSTSTAGAALHLNCTSISTGGALYNSICNYDLTQGRIPFVRGPRQIQRGGAPLTLMAIDYQRFRYKLLVITIFTMNFCQNLSFILQI